MSGAGRLTSRSLVDLAGPDRLDDSRQSVGLSLGHGFGLLGSRCAPVGLVGTGGDRG